MVTTNIGWKNEIFPERDIQSRNQSGQLRIVSACGGTREEGEEEEGWEKEEENEDKERGSGGPMKFIICRSSSGVGDNGARVALGLASFLFKF